MTTLRPRDPIVSWAVNHEDVLLRRVFAEVEVGSYVDVGANHPTFHSLTKTFYDVGWSGINIEPLKALYESLVLERTRDINLNIACSDAPGPVTLYTPGSYDELSTLNPDSAFLGPQEGVTSTVVEALTLREVVDEYVSTEVHFLKIDVEGAELQVLKGADFSTFRPWVIVVELARDGYLQPEKDEILDLLHAAGYDDVFFDGINEYFLDRARKEQLGHKFSAPVNVNDNYIEGDDEVHQVFLEIGALLGCDRPGNPAETMLRVQALLSDRIRFETIWQELSLAQRRIGILLGSTDPDDPAETYARAATALNGSARSGRRPS